MHRFIDVAHTRNSKIYEYNSLYALLEALQKRIDVLENQITLAQSELARKENPAVDIMASIINDGLRSTKDFLVYLLFQANRAQNYLVASSEDTPINDSSVALLEMSGTFILTRLVRDKERLNSPDQKVKDYALQIEDLVSEAAFKRFKQLGSLTFTLRTDTPQARDFMVGLALVRVRTITFEAPELSSQKRNFTIRIIHQGNSKLINPSGKAVQFSHLPFVGANIFQNGERKSRADISDPNNEYLGVSLLGTWTIHIDPSARRPLTSPK
jgi:hypothetical protein